MIRILAFHNKHRLGDLSRRSIMAMLPPDIREKASRFHHWRDAQACMIGRRLLAYALNGFGMPNALGNIRYNEFGRPLIDGPVDINISHSGNWVICGVSDTSRIGIDIEQVQPTTVTDFYNYLDEDEKAAIERSSDRIALFFHFWTRKESTIKADGRGLSFPLLDVKFKDEGVAMTGSQVWHYYPIGENGVLNRDGEFYSAHLATDQELGLIPEIGEVGLNEIIYEHA
jgi:4'-phosphopantetheinyl transferase